MKIKIIAVLLASAFTTPVLAQTYEPDMQGSRVSGDYGDLLRQVIGGQDVKRKAPEKKQSPKVDQVPVAKKAIKSASSPSIKKPVLEPEAPIEYEQLKSGNKSGSWFLHDASEYKNEEHKVRLVDRNRFDDKYLPATVDNSINLAPNTILIDTKNRQLFYAMSNGKLRRYGVAVGKDGARWKGSAVVGRKAKWPDWHPTANIRKENKKLPAKVNGGSSNPLGARALYLYEDGRDTLYRIHGTTSPYSIGTYASHGCIRMVNEDVIELFSMVGTGANVIVR